jgi:hypothetical protein
MQKCCVASKEHHSTLDFSPDATNVSPILTSLRDHPRRLCLTGQGVDLTGLETALLSDTTKITELEINRCNGGLPIMDVARVLEALARRPTLTKLGLRACRFGRLHQLALRNIPSLQSLDLRSSALGSAELAELAPVLYHNTSIKVLDMSYCIMS